MNDNTIGELRGTLDRTSTRSSVTAANLANVDTPGYRALQVAFEETLDAVAGDLEMSATDPEHVQPPAYDEPRPIVSDAPPGRMRVDGNTVDIDREMTELARLQGRYAAAAQLVRKRFALVRLALTDGRGAS
jgi:flagellar basal-body rod protein FlgB